MPRMEAAATPAPVSASASSTSLCFGGIPGSIQPVRTGVTAAQPAELHGERRWSLQQVLDWLQVKSGNRSSARSAAKNNRGIEVEDDIHIDDAWLLRLISQHATGAASEAVGRLLDSSAAADQPVAPAARVALVDLSGSKMPRRLNEVDQLLRQLLDPTGDPAKFDQGVALFMSRYPGLLSRVLDCEVSGAARDTLVMDLLSRHRPALEVMNGLVAKFLTKAQYVFIRNTTEKLLLGVSGDGMQLPCPFILGRDAAALQGTAALPELPEHEVSAVADDFGAVGVRVGVANLLRWLLQIPGIRGALQEMGTQVLLVKVCVDAAALVGARNVTAASIMIVLSERGGSSRYVCVESLYGAGDHHKDQATFLELGTYAEFAVLESEGLGDVSFLNDGDEFRLPVSFIFTDDGAARRVALGAVGASGLFPVPGVPVQKVLTQRRT